MSNLSKIRKELADVMFEYFFITDTYEESIQLKEFMLNSYVPNDGTRRRKGVIVNMRNLFCFVISEVLMDRFKSKKAIADEMGVEYNDWLRYLHMGELLYARDKKLQEYFSKYITQVKKNYGI